MNPKVLFFGIVMAICMIGARAGRMFIVDEEELQHLPRFRRDVEGRQSPQGRPLEYNPVPPVDDLSPAGSDSYSHGSYKPGRVGPVYTFVKTDPYAHVKWGVRHVVGKKYAPH